MTEQILSAVRSGNFSHASALMFQAGLTAEAKHFQNAWALGKTASELLLFATGLLEVAARRGAIAAPVQVGRVGGDISPADFDGIPTNPIPIAASGGILGAIGGALGSLIPGVGTAIGGVLGTAVGNIFGGGSGGLPPGGGIAGGIPPPGGFPTTLADPGAVNSGGFGGILNNIPLIPGGLLTPGVGPTLGQVGGLLSGLFDSSTEQPQMPPQLQLAGGPGFGVSATQPTVATRLSAPMGFVIVSIKPNDPFYQAAVQQGGVPQRDGSVKLAMRREVARKMGYWKARVKPLLTSSERRTIRKAATLKRKVARVAKAAGVDCKMPTRRRR